MNKKATSLCDKNKRRELGIGIDIDIDILLERQRT